MVLGHVTQGDDIALNIPVSECLVVKEPELASLSRGSPVFDRDEHLVILLGKLGIFADLGEGNLDVSQSCQGSDWLNFLEAEFLVADLAQALYRLVRVLGFRIETANSIFESFVCQLDRYRIALFLRAAIDHHSVLVTHKHVVQIALLLLG